MVWCDQMQKAHASVEIELFEPWKSTWSQEPFEMNINVFVRNDDEKGHVSMDKIYSVRKQKRKKNHDKNNIRRCSLQ